MSDALNVRVRHTYLELFAYPSVLNDSSLAKLVGKDSEAPGCHIRTHIGKAVSFQCTHRRAEKAITLNSRRLDPMSLASCENRPQT